MKKILFILLIYCFAGISYGENLNINNSGNCIISIDRTSYNYGEGILLTVTWEKCAKINDISSYLMNGDGNIQIISGSQIICSLKMSPISAPKIDKDRLSFTYYLSTKNPDLHMTEGKYIIRIVSHNWTSNEVPFKIINLTK